MDPELNTPVIQGLFQKPLGDQKPLQPRHIQEAFRILQIKKGPLNVYKNGIVRKSISLF
jgi:hypothetical protein